MISILFLVFLLESAYLVPDCSSCVPNSCNCNLFPCPNQPARTNLDYTKGLPNGNQTSLPLVDYEFIAAMEGRCQCAFIPFVAGNCAVDDQRTLEIGIGVNLGDKSEQYFTTIGVDPAIIAKLRPFLGIGKGNSVVNYCEAQGWEKCRLQLSAVEETHLSTKVLDSTVRDLEGKYNDAKTGTGKALQFAQLPRGVRTAIAAVYYQYPFGTYPAFWNAVINEEWETASYALLYSTGSEIDRTRREAEEAILRLALVTPCQPREPKYQVMFILDSSGSIGSEAYEQEKKFVRDLCIGWKVSENNVRVAILIYSSTVQLATDFTGNKEFLIETINKLPYLATSTATGDAIRKGIQYFISNKAGVASPRIMFLLTDGWSNLGENVSTAIRDMKAEDVNSYAIGVGSDIRRDELLQIASKPDNVYNVSSFQELQGILHSTAQRELQTFCRFPR